MATGHGATLTAPLRNRGGVPGELVMYDTITPALLPAVADAYGAYVGGGWPTYNAVRAAYPRARILSIAVNAAEAAECLDIESGDAALADAPGWHGRAVARGVTLPADYASVSKMAALAAELAAAGIGRPHYRLWSAHYGAGPHICGPSTCAYRDPQGRMVPQCDGTQWTDAAHGMNLDASLLVPDFFTRGAPAPKPPQEADVYDGQIPAGAEIGVPVVIGSVNRCALYADFTTTKAPLSIRVAVMSAKDRYSQIEENVVLDASQPYYIAFHAGDVCAVSFKRTDKDPRSVGYFITG